MKYQFKANVLNRIIQNIIKAAKDNYYNMMERNLKFQNDSFEAEILWDNYLMNEVLNKYISFRRISK